MNATTADIPLVDGAKQECITDEQARAFKENGVLVIRNLLRGEELKALQEQTLPLVERAMRERVQDPDFLYMKHQITGKDTPFRIEYVINRLPACKALLGHPFILRTVEKLQGRNFIPTFDAMVYKTEGAGAAISWHRDGGGAGDPCEQDLGWPIFNVDFYLDESDMSNCLWGIPGSNLWPSKQAWETIARLNEGGFKRDGVAPIPMKPGDVIFHDVRLLHGSPAAQTHLRRVIYYEFRPAEIEVQHGPHRPEYIPLKQRVLLACLRHRAAAPYAKGEKPFAYNPSPEFPPPPLRADEELETYRYPHGEFWRKG